MRESVFRRGTGDPQERELAFSSLEDWFGTPTHRRPKLIMRGVILFFFLLSCERSAKPAKWHILLVVFSVTPFKIDQNKNQNRPIDKVQILRKERR